MSLSKRSLRTDRPDYLLIAQVGLPATTGVKAAGDIGLELAGTDIAFCICRVPVDIMGARIDTVTCVRVGKSIGSGASNGIVVSIRVGIGVVNGADSLLSAWF